MQKLAYYIEELLLKHECVIVPDFGGFVANYKSASVDHLKGKFSPPSKLISFNKNLKNNDGLLANHITTEDGVSYEQALENIKQIVAVLKNRLSEEKSVQLKNIGQLYVDTNENLRFEPSSDKNFLLDSYGLSVFNLPELELETKKTEDKKEYIIPEKKEVKVVQLEPEQKNQKEQEKKNAKIVPILKKVGYAAALIPFIAYLFWVPMKTEILNGDNFTYADLNPFSEKICPEYKARIMLASIDMKEPSNELLETIKNAEKEVVHISLYDKEDENYDSENLIAVRIKEYVAEPESTMVAVSKKKVFKYHIIAGCFKEYKNAERLSLKLRKDGFSSAIIDKNNGLFRVSFQSYASRKEAIEALITVKKGYNSSAWLLVK